MVVALSEIEHDGEWNLVEPERESLYSDDGRLASLICSIARVYYLGWTPVMAFVRRPSLPGRPPMVGGSSFASALAQLANSCA